MESQSDYQLNTTYHKNNPGYNSKNAELKFIKFNPLEAEIMLQLILPIVEERVKKLEEAQKVSKELLDLVIII